MKQTAWPFPVGKATLALICKISKNATPILQKRSLEFTHALTKRLRCSMRDLRTLSWSSFILQLIFVLLLIFLLMFLLACCLRFRFSNLDGLVHGLNLELHLQTRANWLCSKLETNSIQFDVQKNKQYMPKELYSSRVYLAP